MWMPNSLGDAPEEASSGGDQFFMLFSRHPTPMWIADVDTLAITEVNDAALARWGYARNEVLDMTLREVLPPEGIEKLTAGDERPRRAARFSAEWTLRSKDGRTNSVDINSYTVHFAGRVAIVVIAQDITHGVLREREEQLRLFVDHSPAAIAMFDRNMRYLVASRRWMEDYRLGDASVIGRSHYEIFPEIPDHWKEVHRRCLAGAVEKCDEDPFLRADGSIDWIRWEVRPWHRADASIGGIVIFSEDISPHKRAEEAVRKSEAKFRAVVENGYDGILFTDADAKILYRSPSYSLINGYTDEEGIGHSCFETVYPEDVERVRLYWAKVIEHPEAVHKIEYRIRHREGTWRWIESSSANLLANPNVQSVVVAARDITDRKHSEEEKENLHAQLLQAQKMESVGRLAGGVAHDFNNMLGVILGHTEMALEKVDPILPLHEDLKAIHAAANRSAELTRQLLAFARKQTAAPKVLDLNQTVEEMMTMLARLIGEDVQLIWEPKPDLWTVRMDPSQLGQILSNLCVNARDAIDGVGKIVLKTENAVIDEAGEVGRSGGPVPGEYVLLTVCDYGCGMSGETLSHLFEPFFTTKGVGKGTGLGLAMVYGIVKQNSGFITVESARGRGTTFSIHLPRQTGEAGQTRNYSLEVPVSSGHETILVVEDEAANLKLIRRMLERQGYAVLQAGTPGQAIRIASKHVGEIRLLITDVIMPEMNGRELARKVLSYYPNLKCLFISGYTADVISSHGVLEEGVSFIQKPFSAKALGEMVRETLKQVT
jgi:PAS domain S-box-containing protein